MSDQIITNEYQDHVKALELTVSQNSELILQLSKLFCECFRRGNKLMICGNGGSAADAQHVAAEFVNRFRFDRAPLAAIALTTDTSILTCVGNDSNFDYIFSRQVEAWSAKGDILVGISTSGRSANVLKALEVARTRDVITVGFTGEKGRENMAGKCDHCLVIPSADTARIQECHEFVWHVVCGMVEAELFQSH